MGKTTASGSKRKGKGSDDRSKEGSKKKKESCVVLDPIHLNPVYEKVKEELKNAFIGKDYLESDLSSNGIQVISHPFKCLVLPDFIEDNQFLEKLKEELDLEVDYY